MEPPPHQGTSARHSIETPEDGRDLAALVDLHDVNAVDHRLPVGRAEVPAEPGLAVMGVDRPGASEDQAGELTLRAADGGGDLGLAVPPPQWVDVVAVGRPGLVD